MPEVLFYQDSEGSKIEGAITFKTNGGITVGDSSTAREFATKVSIGEVLTSGTTIGKLTINGIDTTLKTPSYTADTGIKIENYKISNTGVTSISTGSSNGTIKVTTGGTTNNVSVQGLGSAAYKNATDFAAFDHSSNNPNYGAATNTTYGHIKIATGDLYNTVYGPGVAAGLGHTHGQYYDAIIERTKRTVLAAPEDADGFATFRRLSTNDLPVTYGQYLGNYNTQFNDNNIPTMLSLNRWTGNIGPNGTLRVYTGSGEAYSDGTKYELSRNKILISNKDGYITGAETPLPIALGGTGATTASGARTALGITPANIGAVPQKGGTAEFAQKFSTSTYIGSPSTPIYINNLGEPRAIYEPLPVDLGGTGTNSLSKLKGNLEITPLITHQMKCVFGFKYEDDGEESFMHFDFSANFSGMSHGLYCICYGYGESEAINAPYKSSPFIVYNPGDTFWHISCCQIYFGGKICNATINFTDKKIYIDSTHRDQDTEMDAWLCKILSF